MLASDDLTNHLRAVSGNSQPQKGRGRNTAWKVAGDLPSSFRYAAQGLAYGFVSQRNFPMSLSAASPSAWACGCSSAWTA
jgi:diacylglycerol kinase (ATP)